jgi:polar amino acid transport system substrate-binding protein
MFMSMRIPLVAAIVALAVPATAFAQTTPSQRGSTVSQVVNQVTPEIVKSFAPTGKLRAAINQGNSVLVQKQADGSEPKGVTIMLAKELGKRLGVPVELVLFNAAGDVFAALKEGRWDIAFLAIEPVRAAEIDFTPPYVIIEGAYMVAKDSPLQTPADVDKKGIRIAVGKGSAYDLYLTRTLKHAKLLRTEGGCCKNVDLFRAEKLDAVAGVRQPLAAYAKQHADVRVMEKPFQQIRQAMGTPKGRTAAAAYLRTFIEEMKANGFVADALKRSNQPDAQVAPAGG